MAAPAQVTNHRQFQHRESRGAGAGAAADPNDRLRDVAYAAANEPAEFGSAAAGADYFRHVKAAQHNWAEPGSSAAGADHFPQGKTGADERAEPGSSAAGADQFSR
jgi:hypothetical protein